MTALLYHDVLGDRRTPESGFNGADADVYKLQRDAFEEHLNALATAGVEVFSGSAEALPGVLGQRRIAVLTFDDGGASAWPVTAEALDRRGWKGVFFITTGRIDTPGFLDRRAIRSLSRAGHLVGSHSVTHPARMGALSPEDLRREWGESRQQLEELLGVAVTFGSVPGGYHSTAVAEAAQSCGYCLLFTSEPRRTPWPQQGLLLAGRFSIMHDTPARVAAALSRGELLPCWRQAAMWSAKKVVKRLGGRAWLDFRRRYWAWKAKAQSPTRRTRGW